MAAITALPTSEGIGILNSELISGVTKFILVGRSEFSYQALDALLNKSDVTLAEIEPYIFAELDIESALYDEKGVLTFHLSLPYDTDYSKYIYAIGLLHINGATKKLVSIAKTPKVAKVAGVGGSFTYKVAVLGGAGEVVFKVHDYVTTSELEYAIDFQNISILALSSALTKLTNKLIEKGVITNG
jgi:hypothetical protein